MLESKRIRWLKCNIVKGENNYDEFYKKFFSEKELILPIGKYEISTMIVCSLDENDILGSQYKKFVSANITVTK